MPQCTLIFRNDTDPSWNVVITQIGGRFWYQDSNGATVGDWHGTKNVHISSGQQDTFISNDPSKCVRENFGGMTVYVPGDGERSFGSNSPGDAQHCQLQCAYALGRRVAITGATETLDQMLASASNSSEKRAGQFDISIEVDEENVQPNDAA